MSVSGSSMFSKIGYVLFVVLFVVGILVGFAASFFMAQGNGILGGASSLSDSDKNFFLNVANAQLQFTGQNDWCTVGGGFWYTVPNQAQIPVDLNQAATLQSQGATINKDVNGNLFADVVAISRVACVVIPGNSAANGAAQSAPSQ